jgi:fimbrial isopeptide formation D2 family protein/uncharacterized repeat protein (TIGR01451 family)
MKNKIKISLVLTLLILTSLFYPVNALDITTKNISTFPTEEIEVIKTVWDTDLGEWVEYYEAELNEIVTFNITIIYRKTCPEGEKASDIRIVDTLPPDLNYTDSSQYNESWIDGDRIHWNLTADYGIYLYDNESLSIEFNASVDKYGEHENFAECFGYETSCSVDLYGYDKATVNAEAPPYLEFDKYVYNPEEQEWVELLDSVLKNQVVRFKIVVTFVWHESVELMKFMRIDDEFAECCLQYVEGSEEFEYPSVDFEDPDIKISSSQITYDWSEKQFNLFAGETITITFNTTVFQYCDGIVENLAFVDMWDCTSCPEPVHLTDSDTASVNCTAPPPIFDKWIKDPDSGQWVELINVYLDDEVTFKIELTYFGNYNLSNISVEDNLPCALEFIEGSADPSESDVSEDLKTIWWNITEPLNDSETLTIEFDALVVDENCGEPGINIATVDALEHQEPYTATDTASVNVLLNNPPCPPDITGDTFGEPGDELVFYVKGIDPEENDIYYKIDWGDGTQTDWLGPYNSGEGITQMHIWEVEDVYSVRAKSKDDPHEEESQWSLYPVEVTIEKIPRSLDVELRLGFQRGLTFEIENTGEGEVTDINWSITVTRRGLIKRVLLDEHETIPQLDPNEDTTVKKLPKFGFWLIEVKLKVDSPDIDGPIEITAKGFIMFRFIRLRRFF